MAYTTINKSKSYFNTVSYSGTGSAQSITGVGFQPDWLWIKHREDVSNHKLQDVIRGSTKVLGSNEASAEATVAQGVTSFDSDGFSLGTDASVNGTGAAGIVAWNWLAGGSQGSSNTDGSINTTYTSVNTTAGFSISQYTGTGSNATVGHGLGAAPKVVIIKNLSGTSQWLFGTTALGFNKFLEFNLKGAAQTVSNRFNDTNPTSSVFSIGTSSGVNNNGDSHIAYCFAEKKGYSKFGSYVGNANADGTFVYTGFKPAFFLCKNSSTGNTNWLIFDNKRSPRNLVENVLKANLNSAGENGDLDVDFLSNGVKMRNTDGNGNENGSTMIYMAFAEEPLVANSGANGVPATAR